MATWISSLPTFQRVSYTAVHFSLADMQTLRGAEKNKSHRPGGLVPLRRHVTHQSLPPPPPPTPSSVLPHTIHTVTPQQMTIWLSATTICLVGMTRYTSKLPLGQKECKNPHECFYMRDVQIFVFEARSEGWGWKYPTLRSRVILLVLS